MINPPTRFEATLARAGRFFGHLRWHEIRRGYVYTPTIAHNHHYLIAVGIAFAFCAGLIVRGCL